MEQVKGLVLYGSKYGSTRRYAQELARRLGFDCLDHRQATGQEAGQYPVIVYGGGLYAGGVLGLAKTLRNFSLQNGQKLILVTVGLADPNEPENQHNIRTSLQKQLPAGLLYQAKIFHLRGGIDYQQLSFGHRTMMKLLYQSLQRTPFEKQTAENRAFIETYGKHVDFTDFRALEPIIQAIQRETI